MFGTIALSAARFYCRRAPMWRGKGWLGTKIKNLAESDRLSSGIVAACHLDVLMELDPKDFLQRTLLLHGMWEPEAVAKMHENLRPGDSFIDCGANIGFLTLVAARLVGNTGRVIAVEASKSICKKLTDNVARNGFMNVEVVNRAVSSQSGWTDLVNGPFNNSGATHMAPQCDNRGAAIETATLDNIVTEYGIGAPTMIKLDIEGAELLALQGAGQILADGHAPVLLIEVSEGLLPRYGHSRAQLEEFLIDLGYVGQVMLPIRANTDGDGRIVTQFDAVFRKKLRN